MPAENSAAVPIRFPEDYTAMAFLTTIAGMNVGDCGFPRGGSRALAKRMETKYRALGGRVNYNSKIDKVLVRDGKAEGILSRNA
jgi:phytoene dehydrogenase-like protein